MSYQTRVILIGVLAVIVFDAIAALASRRFGFAYAKATVGSALIYGTIGFLAARGSDANPLQSAAFAAGIVGLVDASAGWGVSWIIGPGRLPDGTAMTLERWLGAAVFVIALACAIGVVGGVIGSQAESDVALHLGERRHIIHVAAGPVPSEKAVATGSTPVIERGDGTRERGSNPRRSLRQDQSPGFA